MPLLVIIVDVSGRDPLEQWFTAWPSLVATTAAAVFGPGDPSIAELFRSASAGGFELVQAREGFMAADGVVVVPEDRTACRGRSFARDPGETGSSGTPGMTMSPVRSPLPAGSRVDTAGAGAPGGAGVAGTPNPGGPSASQLPRADLSCFGALSPGDRLALALGWASPYIDYEAHDRSPRDGTIDATELAILVVSSGPSRESFVASPDCPSTSGVAIPTPRIGPTEPQASFPCGSLVRPVAYASSSTPPTIVAQALAQEEFHLSRLDAAGVGGFEPMGIACPERTAAPCLPGTTGRLGFGAWTRMHLGWLRPTVVVRDGWYTVNAGDASAAPNAFVLYDDTQGTDDYYLVENRQRSSPYDAEIGDAGLVVWRVKDSWYPPGGPVPLPPALRRPALAIERPDGGVSPPGGSAADAWDAADPATPQRDMLGRTWADGVTPSNVGLLAVGASSPWMRVFFDVRGPGVLVDCGPRWPAFSAPPGRTTTVPVRVRNTGETSDTFTFTTAGLPAATRTASAWRAGTPVTLTLAPGEEAVANVGLRVPPDQAAGAFDIMASGTSTTDPSVTSSCGLTALVALRPSALTYLGPSVVRYGDQVPLGARLVDDDLGRPLAGVLLTFTMTDAGGPGATSGDAATRTQVVTATTDPDGTAWVAATIGLRPGSYTLIASSPQVAGYAPATASVPLQVVRRPAAIRSTGATSGQYSDPLALRAVVTDAASGAPLVPAEVVFRLGTQEVRGSSAGDESGTASATLTLDQPAAATRLTATFAGDPFYEAASVTTNFTIEREDLHLDYQGPSSAIAGAGPIVASLRATQDDGGLIVFPGDPALAEIEVSVVDEAGKPVLTRTVPLDRGWAASVDLPDLGAGRYRIEARVPGSNRYYEGLLSPSAELVVEGAKPTVAPTPEPTPHPTPTSTPEPTAHATPEPTAHPTAEPTPHATPKPTVKPTPRPTAPPEPLEIGVEAFAESICGELASHEVTVSWVIAGGHRPFGVTIHLSLPDGSEKRVHASGREGTERIHVQVPDGGRIGVRVRAVDSDGTDGVAHMSVEAGRCG